MLVPIFTQITLIIDIIQQDTVAQITKSFVALKIVVEIDDMFAKSLPKEILQNAFYLNSQSKLKISEDNNTTTKILKRMRFENFPQEMVNLMINLWYAAISNFQLVVFNYFGCII